MFKHLIISEEFANKAYDLLVSIGGADEKERRDFIHHFCKVGCTEWRFQGFLGFGGKYRNPANIVTCYFETETPVRLEIIKELNEKLKILKNETN